MNRKFFLCLSRVIRFFIVLPHFDITNARHIHSTPLPSTCGKKKLTTHPTANYSLFTTCNSLCTTQYYLLIDYCSLIKATCSLLPAHNSLFTIHILISLYSPLTIHHFSHNSFSLLTTQYLRLTTHYSVFISHHRQRTTRNPPLAPFFFYYSPLITHCPLYEYWSIITHDLLLTINHSPLTAHYRNSLRTTNEDNVLCFTPFHIFDQQVDEHVTWWIASFSSSCRVCFVSSLLISTHKRTPHSYNTPVNQRVKKKKPSSPLIAHYSLFTTHYLLLATYKSQRTAHCSQLSIYYSLFITDFWLWLLITDYRLFAFQHSQLQYSALTTLLFTIHFSTNNSQPTIHSTFFTTHHSLPTTHYTNYSSLRNSH